MIHEEISLLKKSIVEYTNHIQKMLLKSSGGVFERNSKILAEVINADETLSNQTELAIDEKAISVIAKFQPVAKNLRVIVGIIKISNTLERIGDHCVNIARSGNYLNQHPIVKPFIDLPKMKEAVKEMLDNTAQTLLEQDNDLAYKVLAMDEKVDDFKALITNDLIIKLHEKEQNVKAVVEILNITNNLERIADLSTNICEDIIYMETGATVRHQHL